MKEMLDDFAISLKGYAVNAIKFNPHFYRILRELEKSQWYSLKEFEELQKEKLQRLIAHAYDNVPYYHELFKKLRLKPEDFQHPSDLEKLPILEKETVRQRPQDFVARNVNHFFKGPGWTTGTTGTPINTLRSFYSICFENAMFWRMRRWAKFDFSCRKVAVWGTIWNRVVIPARVKNPPFWRRNIADNQLILSYYHISHETLPLYFEKMKKFKPDFIEAFPSTFLALARYLKKQNMFFPIKGVFTSSETLYDIHRRDIEERFQTKIYELYGQAERVVAATECEQHQGLHINPEYGIFEIIKNNQPQNNDDVGEVVGTGLNNFLMPLIRYRTGDLASMNKQACSCGRKMPLLKKIEGRITDSIMTPDGRMIPGSGVMNAFHGIDNIKTSQIIQDEDYGITVNIVKEKKCCPVDWDNLKTNLIECIGQDVPIQCDIVSSLSIQNQEKFRWVLSKVTNYV